MKPNIAVLMAAYNTEKTLNAAVDSILASTVPFHLFIVDDASRTPVTEVLKEDPRITVLRLETNGGLANALNHGLTTIMAAGYPYIARMDTDDIAHPQRLEKQLAFLEAHPEIDLVGTWARFFDEHTGATTMFYNPPASPEGIRKALLSNSAVLHPTWFFRAALIAAEGPYSTQYKAAEDYEFLCRVAPTHAMANIPEYLLDYRISSGGISLQKRRRQLADRLRIQLRKRALLTPAFWLGLAKTLALFAVPVSLLARLKALLNTRKG